MNEPEYQDAPQAEAVETVVVEDEQSDDDATEGTFEVGTAE